LNIRIDARSYDVILTLMELGLNKLSEWICANIITRNSYRYIPRPEVSRHVAGFTTKVHLFVQCMNALSWLWEMRQPQHAVRNDRPIAYNFNIGIHRCKCTIDRNSVISLTYRKYAVDFANA
jgi:hypothetical protein